jgi:hypothetical protein
MASNDQLRETYRDLHEEVVDALNADSVLDFLFAAKVLSAADLSSLVEMSNGTKKTRKLMSLLHKSRNPAAFIKLHEAIKKEKAYAWLAEKVDDLRISSKGAALNASNGMQPGNTATVCEKNLLNKLLI